MGIENEALSDRGFKGGKFTDRYGEQCSIQESSLAVVEGDEEGFCIWLGIDKPSCSSGRMHLSQRQTAELIPHLQYFVQTGYLPSPGQLDEFVDHIANHGVQDIINDFFAEVST